MISTARRNLAFDTIDRLADLTSLSEIVPVFGAAIADMGFTTFGIACMPPAFDGANPLIVAELAPADFRPFYKRERLYNINHIAAHLRITPTPFRYSEAPHDASRPRDANRFTEILSEYRIGKGIVVPVGRPRHVPACTWVGGENPDLDDEVLSVIQLVALFVSSKAYALAHTLADKRPPLTARERDVLSWAAHGKSAWEIGEILRIAKRTVDEHTQSAARKLGASNKTQAVALALIRGLIEI